ncbi:MAG TPA: SURF1 family protein [Acidimicrobiales bacterium]|nr:SURF1 family protein [Acidimicrobiales bacterium]
MRRVLLRPRWVIGSVIVVLIAVLFVNLGFWQLRRLHERRHHNAVVKERAAALQPLPADGWLPSPAANPDDLAYRRVRVTGTYDPSKELLVRFQTRNGTSGYDVVTPLVTADGVVLVDRGWVPLQMGRSWPDRSAAAPSGTVSVQGLLDAGPDGSLRAAHDISGGPLVVGAVDAKALRSTLGYPRLYAVPLLLDAGERQTTGASFPVPPPAPDLSEGPHLSYALQWFSFTIIGVVGWLFVLRRALRDAAKEPAATPAPG